MLVEPAIDEWPSLLRPPTAQQRELQREILEAAQRWTAEQQTLLGHPPGIPQPQPPPLQPPLVMTGHQPIIYHHGIIAKHRAIARLQEQLPQSASVSIIIDTDQSDGHELRWPASVDGDLAIRRVRLARGDALYLHDRLRNRSELEAAFSKGQEELRALRLDAACSGLERAAEYYLTASDQPLVGAASAVRRALEPTPVQSELPLSRLLQLGSLRAMVRALIEDGPQLHQLYNEELDRFRSERGTRNQAQPFPNLRQSQEASELPLWIIDLERGGREVLQRRNGAGESLIRFEDRWHPLAALLERRDILIAPRGALISSILRLDCCALFVHGTGGARYDQFTDRFIARYFGRRAAPFVRATDSRYVFPDKVIRYEGETARRAKERAAHFHPLAPHTRHLFNDHELQQLEVLEAQRMAMVPEIRRLRTAHAPRREYTQRFKALDRERHALVQPVLERHFGTHPSLPAAQWRVYAFREYPFFLIPEEKDAAGE